MGLSILVQLIARQPQALSPIWPCAEIGIALNQVHVQDCHFLYNGKGSIVVFEELPGNGNALLPGVYLACALALIEREVGAAYCAYRSPSPIHASQGQAAQVPLEVFAPSTALHTLTHNISNSYP